MKIRLHSIILLAFFATTSQAKVRTTQQIMNCAQQVLGTGASTKAHAANRALKVVKQESQLSIVSDATGRCAIIANDDAFSPVLGYTDKAMGADIAPGFKWWLETINQALEQKLAKGETQHQVARNAAYKTNVPELMSTEWGQDAPYNLLCPQYTENGESHRYVTGCVATAMAQIMNYHQYPLKGEGKYSYRYNPGDGAMLTLVADFKNTTYDWANMLDEYNDGAYTDAQANAVATLMYQCGVSVKMNYNKDGSGAYTADACRALRKYFAYSPNIKLYERSYFPIDEWMNIIYRELNDGCPILYAGSSAAGGHEFVFDGYDPDGNVHVNWGWNGNQDGFFNIASLNGFSDGQEMVVVRTPDDTRYTDCFKSLWGLRDPLSIAKAGRNLSVSGNVMYNFDVDDFKGDISLVARNETNGAISVLSQVADLTDTKTPYLNGFSFEDFTVNPSSLADGQYRLYFASKSISEEEWQPVRSHESVRNSYVLTLEKGKVASLTPEKTSNWTATGITEVSSSEPAPYTYVYNAQGQQIYQNRTVDFNLNEVPARGLLIIKQGNQTRKVIK